MDRTGICPGLSGHPVDPAKMACELCLQNHGHTIDNLPHIEVMKIVFGIVLVSHFGKDKVLPLQVTHINFAALHHQACLAEDHIVPIGSHRIVVLCGIP